MRRKGRKGLAISQPHLNMEVLESSLEEMVQSLIEKKLENLIPTNSFSKENREENEEVYKYKERVKVGVKEDGSPAYTWVYANSKDDLHNAIANALAKPHMSAVEAPVSASKDGWYDRAIHWFETFHAPTVRPTTLAKDKSLMYRHVAPAFGDKPITDITTYDVQTFLQTKQKYSKALLRDMISMMKSVFADAYEDGVIKKNPMDSKRISNPSKRPDNIRRALTPDEQADILANMDKLTEPNARRLMGLLMFTPMRPCEIYGAQWGDLDLDRMELHVCRNKTFVSGKPVIGETKTEGSKRYQPIDQNLLHYLEPIGKEGFIIDGITSEIVARRLWERIKKVIDLHGMTPYMGRHTFATNMSRAGVPLKTAMVMMGHADERMLLRRYTHVDESDLQRASVTMSNFMSNFGGNVKQGNG